MDTKTLEYIIAIADEQSISKAADKVFLSQPALSQHLKKIETKIGAPLFIRTKKKWQLTEIGKVYVYGARNILHIYNTNMTKLDEIIITQSNRVNIIISNSLLNFVKKIILKEFSEIYPNIEINIQGGNSIQINDYIANGLPYLTIFYDIKKVSSFFETKEIFNDELYLCINKDNALNNEINGIVDISKLEDEFFILSKTGTSHRDIQENLFKVANINPRILGESTNFSSAIHMLRSGYGCTFLPKALCQFKSRTFDAYKTDPPCPYSIHLGYTTSQTLPPHYKKLVEIIENCFKNEFLEYSSIWIKNLEQNIYD